MNAKYAVYDPRSGRQILYTKLKISCVGYNKCTIVGRTTQGFTRIVRNGKLHDAQRLINEAKL